MKKLLKVLAIVLAAVVLLFVVVGVFLPTEYEVRRDIVIDAPADVIHTFVNDLERWPAWEPWREADPTIQITLGDTTAGVGASQTWTCDTGSGVLTFTASDPGSGIEYDMAFEEVYKCKSAVTYASDPKGGTRVRWIMSGDDETFIIGGYFALLADSMIGPMFDSGLQNLKAAAEADHPESTEAVVHPPVSE